MAADIILERKGLRIGGKYRVLLCASCFYFRLPREEWRERARRLKKAGYTCADVYFPWNYHETAPGVWRFDGDADASAFLDILSEEGLLVMARPGPYICSEWDGGGIPAWVLTGGPIRQAEPAYMRAVKEWYRRILPIIAAHQYGQGGSVVLLQVENELDFFDCPDPAAYMRTLVELARSAHITVPVTACAGQGGVARATGLCPEVVPTFNFYPDASDPSFDRVARAADRFAAGRGIPLMISETGGDHFLLRRELAGGAKLLGSYNEVAGYDFGFTNGLNNWGTADSPLSLQSSEYGSDKLISAYGEYTRRAREGRLFAAFLGACGEKIAAATPQDADGFHLTFSGVAEQEPGVLQNEQGERFICVANFGTQDAEALLADENGSVRATVPAHTALFWAFHMHLDAVLPGLYLHRSSAEIIGAQPGRLTLWGGPDAGLTLRLPNGRVADVTGYGAHSVEENGRQFIVRIVSREDAMAELLPAEKLPPTGMPAEIQLTDGKAAPANLTYASIPAGPSLYFEPNGIYRGFARYKAQVLSGRPVLVTGAADFISAYDGAAYRGTRMGNGSPQLYTPAVDKNWTLRVESWGHSNFDDPRLPSLRAQSPKGIGGVYSVIQTEENLLWRFSLADRWLPGQLTVEESSFDPILSPNSWNSTRVPLLAAYTSRFLPADSADAFFLWLKGNDAETALYVDEALVGVFASRTPWMDISPFVKKGTSCRLTLLCRKRDWSQPAGVPVVFGLQKRPVRMAALPEEEISRLSAAEGKPTHLPLRLKPGAVAVLELDLDTVDPQFGHGRINLSDMKLTAVFNGRVVGRLVGQCAHIPVPVGGDPTAIYLPRPWFRPKGNRLVLLLEGIGEQPLLSGIRLAAIADRLD